MDKPLKNGPFFHLTELSFRFRKGATVQKFASLINSIGLLAIVTVVLSSIILSGCSDSSNGGGGPAPQTEYADGIWDGTFTSTSYNDPPYQIIGIISQFNEAHFLSIVGAQYAGTLSGSGNTFSGTVTAFAPPGSMFYDGSTIGPVTIRGTVTTAQSMTGSYSGVGDTGNFSLAYNSIYERDSSLATIAGTYLMEVLNALVINLTLTIANDGTITGSDGSGADYNGQVTILDRAFNCYRITVTESGLGLTYTGLAALGDTAVQNDTLYFGVTSGSTSSVTGSLLRQ